MILKEIEIERQQVRANPVLLTPMARTDLII
jgi:hypothetical protein